MSKVEAISAAGQSSPAIPGVVAGASAVAGLTVPASRSSPSSSHSWCFGGGAAGSISSIRCSPAIHRRSGRRFWELLNATPQQASILTHTWFHRAGGRGGLHAGDAARDRDRGGAVVVGQALPHPRSVLVVANAMPKTAFVPLFYIWLGATLSIYGMSLAISLFITILMIYSGFQGIDRTRSSWRRLSARPKARFSPR